MRLWYELFKRKDQQAKLKNASMLDINIYNLSTVESEV